MSIFQLEKLATQTIDVLNFIQKFPTDLLRVTKTYWEFLRVNYWKFSLSELVGNFFFILLLDRRKSSRYLPWVDTLFSVEDSWLSLCFSKFKNEELFWELTLPCLLQELTEARKKKRKKHYTLEQVFLAVTSMFIICLFVNSL